MDIKAKKYIKYPYEYFAAQVEFGLRVAKILKRSKIAVFKQYTDLYGALANHSWGDTPENVWVNEVLLDFERLLLSVRDSKKLSEEVYKLFLSTPHVYERANYAYKKEPLRFGCFILNYDKYYKKQNLIRLHFSPLRAGLTTDDPIYKVSDLDAVYMPQRRSEFYQMIKFIYDNPKKFKDATHFFSSTWLQNLPEYKSLFPITHRKLETKYFFWFWGQFIRWDYSGNTSRYERFKKALQNAKTLNQAIECVPFKVYDVKIPLVEMFAHYGLTNFIQETEDETINPSLLEFYTSRPLQKQIAYQSEE